MTGLQSLITAQAAPLRRSPHQTPQNNIQNKSWLCFASLPVKWEQTISLHWTFNLSFRLASPASKTRLTFPPPGLSQCSAVAPFSVPAVRLGVASAAHLARPLLSIYPFTRSDTWSSLVRARGLQGFNLFIQILNFVQMRLAQLFN